MGREGGRFDESGDDVGCGVLGVEEEDGKDEGLGGGIFWVKVWRVGVLGWAGGVGDWNEISGLSIRVLSIIHVISVERDSFTWNANFKR